MKSRTWMWMTIVFLFALAIPVCMAAQDKPSQENKHKHQRYKLIDVGTFGGPNFLAMCIPAFNQGVLYDNGPDTGTIGAWPINFGHSVSNSFTLESDATVTDVVLSIWDVNDLNYPETAKWRITAQPFGGAVLASGGGILGYVRDFEGRLWHVWSMEIQNMHARLPRGSYYLEVYDVHTRWNTWAFWGENDGIGCTSQDCPSTGHYDPAMPTGYDMVIGSESFQVLGTADDRWPEKRGTQ